MNTNKKELDEAALDRVTGGKWVAVLRCQDCGCEFVYEQQDIPKDLACRNCGGLLRWQEARKIV